MQIWVLPLGVSVVLLPTVEFQVLLLLLVVESMTVESMAVESMAVASSLAVPVPSFQQVEISETQGPEEAPPVQQGAFSAWEQRDPP
jgi:hypothetical protein